jgi:hypothetical protein
MDRTRRLHRLYPTVWRLGLLYIRLRVLRYLQSGPRCQSWRARRHMAYSG